MARGLPDYSNPSTLISQKLIDVGQVATAIMGVNSVDGAGRIVMYDNFREGVSAWWPTVYGDADLPSANIAYCEVPPASMLLSPGTLLGGGAVSISRKLRLGQPYRMGMEVGIYSTTVDMTLKLILKYAANGVGHQGEMDVDFSSGEVSVVHAAGTEILTTLDVSFITNAWLQFKLAVDTINNTYIRVTIGGEVYRLGDFDLVNTADTDDKTGTLVVYLMSGTNLGAYAYLGHVFFTLDEP
jgi:hypothetical protein